jgi:hypothetical protein
MDYVLAIQGFNMGCIGDLYARYLLGDILV